jgi:hypothetical protein
MLEAEIAGSKGQLIVKDMHSGSFSEREALSPKHSLRVGSPSLSWHAVACSNMSVAVYVAVADAHFS